MQKFQMKDCVCRVVQKLQWNCGAIVPNKRLCGHGSAKVTMELWCNSSK